MSKRIVVNPATAHGKVAVELADAIIRAQQAAVRLKGAIDRMVEEDPATKPQVQQELGLDARGAGDFVALLDAVVAKLTDPMITEFAQRVDQG